MLPCSCHKQINHLTRKSNDTYLVFEFESWTHFDTSIVSSIIGRMSYIAIGPFICRGHLGGHCRHECIFWRASPCSPCTKVSSLSGSQMTHQMEMPTQALQLGPCLPTLSYIQAPTLWPCHSWSQVARQAEKPEAQKSRVPGWHTPWQPGAWPPSDGVYGKQFRVEGWVLILTVTNTVTSIEADAGRVRSEGIVRFRSWGSQVGSGGGGWGIQALGGDINCFCLPKHWPF